MTIGLLFWLVFVLWIIFGVVGVTRPATFGERGWYGHGLFVVVLFFLLGWRTFGFIIKD